MKVTAHAKSTVIVDGEKIKVTVEVRVILNNGKQFYSDMNVLQFIFDIDDLERISLYNDAFKMESGL